MSARPGNKCIGFFWFNHSPERKYALSYFVQKGKWCKVYHKSYGTLIRFNKKECWLCGVYDKHLPGKNAYYTRQKIKDQIQVNLPKTENDLKLLLGLILSPHGIVFELKKDMCIQTILELMVVEAI